jgi:uncharacterized protein (TIGR02757 family)
MEARQAPRIVKPPQNRQDLRRWMDNLLIEFNHSSYLETDPIQLVYGYSAKKDREVAALICALFSFGNVRSIKSSLREILKPLGQHPYQNIITLRKTDIHKNWEHSYYRFYTSNDIQNLFLRLQSLLKEYKSLENFFSPIAQGDPTKGLSALRNWFLQSSPTRGMRFMFADPMASPSKRWHMLLRWLVRKDEIDLGLWTSLKPSQLILPLDTHVFDMVQHMGLTKSKTPSLRAALEVTEQLLEWDPQDPIKYDFALCRLGVLGYKKALLSLKPMK